MRLLLLAALAALPLALPAPLAHEEPPRRSAHAFEVELTGLGHWHGAVHLGGPRCAVVQAQGAATVLGGRATLAAGDGLGAARIALEARAPGVGAEQVAGALPLAMELRPFELRGRDDAAVYAVALGEGAVAAAIGKRATLTLALEHVGAPLQFALIPCEDTPGSSG